MSSQQITEGPGLGGMWWEPSERSKQCEFWERHLDSEIPALPFLSPQSLSVFPLHYLVAELQWGGVPIPVTTPTLMRVGSCPSL